MRCSNLENLQWFVQHNANYQVVDKVDYLPKHKHIWAILMFQKGNSLLHLYGRDIVYISSSVRTSVLQYLLNLGLSLDAENDVS